MYLKEVLNKCKEMGHPMTAMGLYKAGEKNGFIIKSNGKSYDFDKDKFMAWLNKAIEETPKGWLTLAQVSEKFNVSKSQAYILSKDPACEKKNIGAGVGVLYVNPESIEKIINERKEKHSIDWSEYE